MILLVAGYSTSEWEFIIALVFVACGAFGHCIMSSVYRAVSIEVPRASWESGACT